MSSISRDPRRAGISLIELMVVVTVLGVLGVLLIPAVQSVRETSRRFACANNLKQIALGIRLYESAMGTLPVAARVSEGTDTTACTGCWNPRAEAGLAAGFVPGTKHGTSWILEIMPQIGEAGLAAAWNLQTNVSGNAALAGKDFRLLYCPSRRSGIRRSADDHLGLVNPAWTGGGTDYGGCMGRVDGFDDTVAADHRFAHRGDDDAFAAGCGPFVANMGVPLAAIADGCSNTILVGELQRLRPVAGGSSPADTDWRTSHDGWAVGGAATLFSTLPDPAVAGPGGINNGFFESPGSDHHGGAFFAMADGSVRFIADSVDASGPEAVLPLLGSIADGRGVSVDALQ